MFIKYVLIKKFKSYREHSYMEPLTPAVNAIIGANGHGKSNFLDAIIFVLTDKYSNLRQEDKKLLVHEEQGEEVQQISVELIIDNKSRRFPVDKDTVSIQKIYNINDNREDILINQKKLMKSDVYNLLESAGFCKQNPYYIIQQGKISTLINMNETELFEQFTEVTGTKIYEEKKAESLALLKESGENRNKIIKQGEEISEYIKRLDKQCTELSQYEKLEIKKKAYEFFIYNEKVSDFQISCDLLEERKRDQLGDLQAMMSAVNKYKEKINERVNILNKLNKVANGLRAKIQRCDQEIAGINQNTFKDEASLKIISERNKNNTHEMQIVEAEITQLHQETSKLEVEKMKIDQKLSDLANEISSHQKKFNELKSKSELILLKQSGAQGFKSENDRKNFLKNEIGKLIGSKEETISKIVDLDASINCDDDNYIKLAKELEGIEQQTNKSSSELKNINDSIIEKKRKRIECVNSMKKVDIESHELTEEMSTLKDSLKGIERSFPNFDVFNACLAIKNQNIPGVYGILLDVIKVDKNFRNAIDIIAKDKLYSLIVDTLDTANKVLDLNKQANGPVISILPIELNNKDIKEISYPTGSEAVPLMEFIRLNTDILIEKNLKEDDILCIVNKIFSKCLLVKNYDTGVKLAKQYSMNCITSDNEIIYAGAYVTKVGYYDFNRQRCNLYEQYLECIDRLSEINSKLSSLENSRIVLANSETKIIRESQGFANRKQDISLQLQELSKRQQNCSEEMMNIKEICNSKKFGIEKLIQDKSTIEQRIANYTQLLSGKNTYLASQAQEDEINSITKEKEAVEKKLIELEKAKHTILQQKISIDSRLNDFIHQREIELKKKRTELTVSDTTGNFLFNFAEEKAMISGIENNLIEIERFDHAKSAYKDELSHVEQNTDVISHEISGLTCEMNAINDKIAREEAELKAIVLSLNDANEKKGGLIKSIANLGQVNSEEVEKISKVKEKQFKAFTNESGLDVRDKEKKLNKMLEPIYAKLEEINRKTKIFEKINRFAIDDYKLFKQKREEITEKLEDLQEKENEILEVISVLDQKKETAIQTTFEKVKKSFEYFFKELVPSGYASLTLEEMSSSQTQSQGKGNNGSLNKGIYITVSFSGSENSYQSMHQLSGGQRTAVAVALIFALSKIDPPPFYILDEIDAALDPSMRANLSKLISSLSESNQYIISTFKPELLEVSNSIYQVKFANKTSTLNQISKDEARKFIKEAFI